MGKTAAILNNLGAEGGGGFREMLVCGKATSQFHRNKIQHEPQNRLGKTQNAGLFFQKVEQIYFSV